MTARSAGVRRRSSAMATRSAHGSRRRLRRTRSARSVSRPVFAHAPGSGSTAAVRSGVGPRLPIDDRRRMGGTRLDEVAVSGHVRSMNTNAGATQITNLQALIAEPTNAQALIYAADRLANAERSVRIVTGLMNSRLPGTPLRIGVEDTRRLRLANAELEAARIAYEWAQDLPAPDD